MLQVTPQKKGDGSELKRFLDELKRLADERCELVYGKRRPRIYFFIGSSIYTLKTTIHTKK